MTHILYLLSLFFLMVAGRKENPKPFRKSTLGEAYELDFMWPWIWFQLSLTHYISLQVTYTMDSVSSTAKKGGGNSYLVGLLWGLSKKMFDKHSYNVLAYDWYSIHGTVTIVIIHRFRPTLVITWDMRIDMVAYCQQYGAGRDNQELGTLRDYGS